MALINVEFQVGARACESAGKMNLSPALGRILASGCINDARSAGLANRPYGRSWNRRYSGCAEWSAPGLGGRGEARWDQKGRDVGLKNV